MKQLNLIFFHFKFLYMRFINNVFCYVLYTASACTNLMTYIFKILLGKRICVFFQLKYLEKHNIIIVMSHYIVTYACLFQTYT